MMCKAPPSACQPVVESEDQNQNQNFVFKKIGCGTELLIPFMCGTGTKILLLYFENPESEALHKSKEQ